MKGPLLVAMMALFPLLTQAARLWDPVVVPGALCGHGSAYKIFISQGRSDKIAYYFQGGGICWDLLTCTTGITTRMGEARINEKGAILSEHSWESPIADWTVVFFPYCTGDIFIGAHDVRYGPRATVSHHGHLNLKKAVGMLQRRKLVTTNKAKQVLFYGASAGALGVALNFTWMHSELTSPEQKISVVMDGMGLHWTDFVWKRFRQRRLDELSMGFASLEVPFDVNDRKPLARYADKVCAKYPEITFGLLQGSMDMIMGMFFGFLTPWQHRKKVYGPDGIFASTREEGDNCAAWVPNTFQHTFVSGDSKKSPHIKTDDGVEAMQFVTRIVKGEAGENHR